LPVEVGQLGYLLGGELVGLGIGRLSFQRGSLLSDRLPGVG